MKLHIVFGRLTRSVTQRICVVQKVPESFGFAFIIQRVGTDASKRVRSAGSRKKNSTRHTAQYQHRPEFFTRAAGLRERRAHGARNAVKYFNIRQRLRHDVRRYTVRFRLQKKPSKKKSNTLRKKV